MKAVHAQAIRIPAAYEVKCFFSQDNIHTITFHHIVIPAFEIALAMGTNFRHRNCFTPNNITSGFCSGGCGRRVNEMGYDKLPFLRRLQNLCLTGRSSDLSRLLKPSHPPPGFRGSRDSGVIFRSHMAEMMAGTYSSGNCCRLSRHSLLILPGMTGDMKPMNGVNVMK